MLFEKEVVRMNPSKMLTENDERLIAREIVNLLLQKGASYNQAVRILKEAKKKIKNIPIYDSEIGCKYTDRPDA